MNHQKTSHPDPRRKTRIIHVGMLLEDSPIAVQSMTNTDTRDKGHRAINRLADADVKSFVWLSQNEAVCPQGNPKKNSIPFDRRYPFRSSPGPGFT
jgi:hypothetical protein